MKKTAITGFASATVIFSVSTFQAAAAGFQASPLADYKEDSWSFAGGFGYSIVSGTAKEHVFAPQSAALDYAREFKAPYEKRRHQLSRLDWDLVSSMVGVSGSARRGRLSFNAGVWYGGSGSDDWEMEDYDWMAGDHVKHTHYSKHDTELTDAWMFDANVSFDILRTDDVSGYVFAGAREQRWKWTCDNFNEYYYPEYGYRRITDREHCIDYRQVMFFGYLGAGGIWRVADNVNFSAYLSWAPCYKGRDRDNHILADKYFIDHFDYDDGNVYGAGVALEWRITELMSLNCAIDWQKATLHEGDLRVEEISTGSVSTGEDSAGFENEYLALTLSGTYRF